jgi:glycerate 2-kinase
MLVDGLCAPNPTASSKCIFFPTITLCELFHKTRALRPEVDASPRAILTDLYTAATTAAAPGPALSVRLDRLQTDDRRVWILALGKASWAMAHAALNHLQSRQLAPAGGLVVTPDENQTPDPRLRCLAGDHPEPGARSFAAAEAVTALTEQVRPGDEVWVLLSGGTTSLIGAPEIGLSGDDLTRIYALLLRSGLDITAMNRIRKRFSRWGGGKLARALAPARVRVYIVSDVIGDDLASIGSGPCVPDPTTASELHTLLHDAGLWQHLPKSAQALLTSTEAGNTPETPKPWDQAFANVSLELVVSNRLALEAAAGRAAELGLAPELVHTPIAGEASVAGASVAAKLLHNCARQEISQPICLIWGGETTVTLGQNSTGLGGRSQELALSAARVLDGAAPGIALLAAGTDGRDGPTDAAGAVVDGGTWKWILEAGRDPIQDLSTHNAYHALDAAGALLRPGLTGTNVMDVVIGLCGLRTCTAR